MTLLREQLKWENFELFKVNYQCLVVGNLCLGNLDTAFVSCLCQNLSYFNSMYQTKAKYNVFSAKL